MSCSGASDWYCYGAYDLSGGGEPGLLEALQVRVPLPEGAAAVLGGEGERKQQPPQKRDPVPDPVRGVPAVEVTA